MPIASDTAYQVLARKFRPASFKDVVGQNHITRTLENAIDAGRVAHAYLFSGPRGVGKTTLARILAKAQNCVQGPTKTPCGTCPSCIEIAEGRSLEVMEVDGASHNGVDQVRSLTDTLKYGSTGERYKIIIIDEVHMLSVAAFNALLKTLEEPPPRVIFVFATTEIHKVLETIQSRCQHFIFTLLPPEKISARLRWILEQEGVQAEEAVFEVIARASGGSMRDAESILEKVITFCGNPLTEKQTLEALGLVARDLFFQIAKNCLEPNPYPMFQAVQAICEEGRNLQKFIQDLIDFFRDFLFLALAPEAPDTENTRLARQFAEHQLLFILDTLVEAENKMRFAFSPKTLAEIALIKCTHSKEVLSVEELLHKVKGLQTSPPANSSPRPPATKTPSPSKQAPGKAFVQEALNTFQGKILDIHHEDHF